MNKIGVGLIGTGEIAQNFHLPVLSNLSNIKLIAICDKINSKAQYVAEKFKIPFVCSSIDELLKIDEIKAVDICTSTDAHYDIIIKCLEAGKNVFVEKPITRTYKEAMHIAEIVKKTKGNLMVGMNQRFRNDVKILKSYIYNREIGEIFYIKSGWLQQKREQQWLKQINKSGGGVLLDLGISLIDLILWLTNYPKIKCVRANTFNHLTKPAEDVCIATLQFENSIVATLETSWTLFRSTKTYYCDFYGKKGRASINPLQIFKLDQEKVIAPISENIGKSSIAILKKSFDSEIKHFIRAVEGLVPFHSTADEAVTVMKIIEALYRSAEEQKEIKIK
jgi:predicted dehydrogenase